MLKILLNVLLVLHLILAYLIRFFSITLDNASANTKAMEKLIHLLSSYVGSLLLHQRCACHIINLIVKAGLDSFKDMLNNFRTAISFLNASNQRIAAYKSYCIAMGVRPRKHYKKSVDP